MINIALIAQIITLRRAVRYQKLQPRCERRTRAGHACMFQARWITGPTEFHPGGYKVCGHHRAQFESIGCKVRPLE
jgi:hypothetical protein